MAKSFNAEPEQVCLIFAGKIMKDHENLATHNIKDGVTVHLVIKSKSRTSETTTAPRPPGKSIVGVPCAMDSHLIDFQLM